MLPLSRRWENCHATLVGKWPVDRDLVGKWFSVKLTDEHCSSVQMTLRKVLIGIWLIWSNPVSKTTSWNNICLKRTGWQRFSRLKPGVLRSLGGIPVCKMQVGKMLVGKNLVGNWLVGIQSVWKWPVWINLGWTLCGVKSSFNQVIEP